MILYLWFLKLTSLTSGNLPLFSRIWHCHSGLCFFLPAHLGLFSECTSCPPGFAFAAGLGSTHKELAKGVRKVWILHSGCCRYLKTGWEIHGCGGLWMDFLLSIIRKNQVCLGPFGILICLLDLLPPPSHRGAATVLWVLQERNRFLQLCSIPLG